MDECEGLVLSLNRAMGRGAAITFGGREICLDPPWERITVRDAFRRYTAMSMEEAEENDMFDELMVNDIEPHLGIERPTFIHDYPASRGALARNRRDDPSVAERFELYIGGIELANAFSELTDRKEQLARFLHESSCRSTLNKAEYPLPHKFLAELEQMPPSAGIALGVDRLVMVLLDQRSIDAVVAFTPEDL
jgi:lysyl-tRNA synthetase class 2